MPLPEENIIFEIADSGNFVRIEPTEFLWQGQQIDWDNNWVRCIITVKGGTFTGSYTAEVMTVDFEHFQNHLEQLYDNLSGAAELADIEDYLKVYIKGDGLGHLEIQVVAQDHPNYGGELRFNMTIDQTLIKELVLQLDRITKHFPRIGME